MKIFISTPNPVDHLVHFKIEFNTYTPSLLSLPAWRPGRYELQNFSQFIREIKFFDGDKRILAERINKDQYEIPVDVKKLKVEYKYYANQMDAGSSWLDDQQLYINFINSVFQPFGYEEYPIHIHFENKENYTLATSLKKTDSILVADNYFELVDSPVICSTSLQHQTYEVGGCNFFIWFQGNCKPNWENLIKQFRGFTEEQLRIFNSFPMNEYHFLIQVLPYKHYHGVEHAKSTVITLGPDVDFYTKSFWENLIGISSHELFHSWNVCKIKPEEFAPHYDFSKEVYYETGYITEGITTYYGDYTLGRSEVFSVTEYFKEIDRYLERYFENDGRHHINIVDSSFKLWLDGYKNLVPNNKVSIYIKGALSALILDLKIRRLTADEFCLDDVLLKMYKKYGDGKTGYNHEIYQTIIESTCGLSVQDYFDEVIFGTNDLFPILNEELNHVGLEIQASPNPAIQERCYGFRFNKDGVITKIQEGSPASTLLDLKDKVLLINDTLPENFIWSEEANHCTLDILRLGQNVKVTLEKGEENYFPRLNVQKIEKPNKQQKTSFEKWLKQSF